MNKRVNSLPLADVACITMELDACKDLARDITLSPNLRERLRQSGWGPTLAAKHCTVCEVSSWPAGPYHLGESSQGREVYRYLERTNDLVLATAAHILKLDRYRED